MGKPRMIIVIRHAQSEGNKNRQIHQKIPDHRVQLTPEGWEQAYEAGRKLRAMLRPDDSLQIFTSPYRRTRETTEGILQTLTSNEHHPSPFSRQTIKVWEEPRLREQDFGNFQPGSEAMEQMWQERAEYGHFFYRIPNGESAADAYDRVSGFNESLWRSFNEPDFPSVCILVTHGLMTRVFLMKWYHWSVEYFEDLRNVNHCEFVVMKRKKNGGKYVLQNELRTWSELKRERIAAEHDGKGDGEASGSQRQELLPEIPVRTRWDTLSLTHGPETESSAGHISAPNKPSPPDLQHLPRPPPVQPDIHHFEYSSRASSSNSSESSQGITDPTEEDNEAFPKFRQKSNPSNVAAPESHYSGHHDWVRQTYDDAPHTKKKQELQEPEPDTETKHTIRTRSAADSSQHASKAETHLQQGPGQLSFKLGPPSYLEAGRDFGGTDSGAPSPLVERTEQDATSSMTAAVKQREEENARKGANARADALGDHESES